MGSGIAQVMATTGLTVRFCDVSEDLVRQGLARIDRALSKSVEKNKLTDDQKAAVTERIHGVVTFDEATAYRGGGREIRSEA